MVRNLSQCLENEIVEIENLGKSKISDRLLELGFVPNTKIKVLQINKSIMCLFIRNTLIGIRMDLAKKIYIK